MSERFIVETVEIIDCCTDESRIAKLITDKNELYSYEDLYEIKDVLNEQDKRIRKAESYLKNFHPLEYKAYLKDLEKGDD